jgi:hypothetical protein
MPNWCSNSVTLKNDNETLLQRFVEAYNDGAVMQAFRPCPQDLIDTVAGSPAGEEERALNEQKKQCNLQQYGHATWYDWNVANWGSKWDFGRREYEEPIKLQRKNGKACVEIAFDTAWSPPLAFYDYMRAEFGFDINAHYFEPGVGYCGTYKNGHDEFVDIESFTTGWLKKHVPAKLLKVFNMIEEAEEMQASEQEWEEMQRAPAAEELKYCADGNEYTASSQDIIIEGHRLICTCGACPEQYEVFHDQSRQHIGYLRLRHGHFRADYPDCGGESVYTADTKGDGIFDDDERMEHLTNAVRALSRAHLMATELDGKTDT